MWIGIVSLVLVIVLFVADKYFDSKGPAVVGPSKPQGEIANPILQWATGPPGTNSIQVLVDTSVLRDFQEHFEIIIICRIQDDTVDSREDVRIERSNRFQITGATRRIQMPMSQTFMRRLLPQGVVQIYALLIPKQLAEDQVNSVNGAIRHGAIFTGARAMLVNTRTSGN